MNQTIQNKIKDKIQEDISPTRNLSGIHLKIVFGNSNIMDTIQLWYASPFPFWFISECSKDCQQEPFTLDLL